MKILPPSVSEYPSFYARIGEGRQGAVATLARGSGTNTVTFRVTAADPAAARSDALDPMHWRTTAPASIR